ncbi:membrane protein [Vibrio mimicus]|uniref:M23 family metallopeptidase n=1 Tax=Vibrio mimicus TaxID=674 RepID=UPI000E07CD8C|nr:M23 family metallopeptidase [Vibrio mimicus]MBY7676651.1 M23 family metallopeptidase [Vibrio mimicus]MBY7728500.1 M23 family metallopeptidase [Vibrio mimicus]TXY30511.1 M23 family metallopeptidase [Vibrio mimicus]SUQ23485.1 membrane protein [Vibrio mimicus]
MKINLRITVLITVLVLPILFIGSKYLTDTKQHEAEQEIQRLLPRLKQIAENTNQAYQYPLDTRAILQGFASFNTSSSFHNLYHAAIDYYAEVGAPVYAISDGIVSYSGYMSGYPGLVIIDHEKDGLYSLYGHLSLKKWMVSLGEVKKGDLLGYIAEPSEDFGIGPFAHIHFAIRFGTKKDYSENGVDRWMAGYTPMHPVFKGFIDPEKFIALTMSGK